MTLNADNIPPNILKCMSPEDRKRYEKGKKTDIRPGLPAAQPEPDRPVESVSETEMPEIAYPVCIRVQPYCAGASRDTGNTDEKLFTDALVQAKVLPDDKPEFVSRIIHERPIHVKTYAEEKTIVTLESME